MAGKLMPRLLSAAVLLLVVQRVAYHAAYLAHDPFALATFSDGQLYERAARDLVAHPPWGKDPFYLQGIYACLLALPMAWWSGPTMGLLLQLAIVALGLLAFHRACGTIYGRPRGAWCTVVLLAYPGLSFYENKYLTAALAEASLCFMLASLAWVTRQARPHAAVAFGLATGLSILARGNMLLGLPAFVVAMVLLGRHHGAARRTVAAFVVGLVLALAPMAIRNAVVTGRPTIFPAHGGGTSFYIGNNARAKGLWNDAGGLLTGDVGRERDELVATLGITETTPTAQAAAIGRALYARAWDEIVADPGRWARLELKKVWLLAGNDELSQDYDVRGEAELVGSIREFGVPFPVLLALGLCGWLGLREIGRGGGVVPDRVPRPAIAEPAVRRAWGWTLAGMALAVAGANVVFFTSAQHRAPLAVVLAALAVPGLVWVIAAARDPQRPAWRRLAPLALLVAVTVQGVWPRVRPRDTPSAAHYHNLALVQIETGQPRAAVATLTRALALDATHPVILIERASLQRKLGMLDGAAADLAVLGAQPGLPPWVAARAAEEQRRVRALRGLRRQQ